MTQHEQQTKLNQEFEERFRQEWPRVRDEYKMELGANIEKVFQCGNSRGIRKFYGQVNERTGFEVRRQLLQEKFPTEVPVAGGLLNQ
jgi:hypothetical protein